VTRFRSSLLLLGVCAACVFAATFALRWSASSAPPTLATTEATRAARREAPSPRLESEVRVEAPKPDLIDEALALDSAAVEALDHGSRAGELEPGVTLVARLRSGRGPAADVDVAVAAAADGYSMRSPERGVRNVTRRVQNAPRELLLAEVGRTDREGRVAIDVTACLELGEPAPVSVLWVRATKSGAVLAEFDVPVPVDARFPRPNTRLEIAVELALESTCAVSGTARSSDDPALRVGVALFESVNGVPDFGATSYATPASVTNGFRFSVDCERESLLLFYADGYRSKRMKLAAGFSGDVGEIKLVRGRDRAEDGVENLLPVRLVVDLGGRPASEVVFRALDAAARRLPSEDFRTDLEGRAVVWMAPNRPLTLEFALPRLESGEFVFAQRHVQRPSLGEPLVLHLQL
jgi:hypothetical protein